MSARFAHRQRMPKRDSDMVDEIMKALLHLRAASAVVEQEG